MKKIQIKLAAAIVGALVLHGCANSDEYDTPVNLSDNCVTLTTTKQVSDFATLATPNYQKITGDDIIEAYVTSSDETGNFYKSLSLVSTDGVTGFSIPIDAYNIYTKFEPGRKVYIRLKDLYFAKENGSTIIGSLYNNDTPADNTDDSVGRLSGVQYQDIIVPSCEKKDEEMLVNRISISEAKNDIYLNKLIEFTDVQFADNSVGHTYYDATINDLGGATNHNIIDADGNSIIFRVSQYASFAGKTISGNSGTIRGVLTKYGSDYQFLARTESDIRLTDPRPVPVFEETFSSNFPQWVKYSVTGSQQWTLDTTHGNPGSCAKMSGFASGSFENEDWLISPAIDLTAYTAARVTFDTAKNFTGNNIEVFVSSDYDGTSAPSTATWTQLSPVLSSGAFAYVASGQLDITALAGNPNVRIAFKYTSTSSASATWEVDNVKVIAN